MELHKCIFTELTAKVFSTNDNIMWPTSKREMIDGTLVFSFNPTAYDVYHFKFYYKNQIEILKSPNPTINVINPKSLKLIHSFLSDGPPFLSQMNEQVNFIMELGNASVSLLKAWVIEPKSKHPVFLYGDDKIRTNTESNNFSSLKQLRCDYKPKDIGHYQFIACLGDNMFNDCPLDFIIVEKIHDTPPLPKKSIIKPPETFKRSSNKASSLPKSQMKHLLPKEKIPIKSNNSTPPTIKYPNIVKDSLPVKVPSPKVRNSTIPKHMSNENLAKDSPELNKSTKIVKMADETIEKTKLNKTNKPLIVDNSLDESDLNLDEEIVDFYDADAIKYPNIVKNPLPVKVPSPKVRNSTIPKHISNENLAKDSPELNKSTKIVNIGDETIEKTKLNKTNKPLIVDNSLDESNLNLDEEIVDFYDAEALNNINNNNNNVVIYSSEVTVGNNLNNSEHNKLILVEEPLIQPENKVKDNVQIKLQPLPQNTSAKKEELKKDEEIVDFYQVEQGLNSGLPNFPQEFPKVEGEGLYKGVVGRKCIFSVSSTSTGGQLTVDVKGPESITKCLIKPYNDSHMVEYYPESIGRYVISMRWNGVKIPTSPYYAEIIDPSQIKCLSHPDLFNGQVITIAVNQPQTLVFDYSRGGRAVLTNRLLTVDCAIKVRGYAQPTNKQWTVWLLGEQAAEKGQIELLWDQIAIGRFGVKVTESPGQIIDQTDKVVEVAKQQIIAKGHGLKESWVGEESFFILDLSNIEYTEVNGADEEALHVYLEGVTKATAGPVSDNDIVAVATELIGGHVYRCKYRAENPGEYRVKLRLDQNYHNTKESDLLLGNIVPIKIWQKIPSRAVVCHGDGLCRGAVGSELHIYIDTSAVTHTAQISSNTVSVSCLDPAGRAVLSTMTKSRPNHYEIQLRPNTAGRHQLNIMYGHVHVPGSPFYPYYSDLQTNSPTNPLLIIDGPGLTSPATLNLSNTDNQSWFTVDATSAGIGQLAVKVSGPQQAFRVEVLKQSSNPRIVKCQYYPNAVGHYTITVLWNKIPVPLSPYHIDVLAPDE